MGVNVLAELEGLSRRLPERSAPWPIAIADLGIVGHMSSRHGLYINSAFRHHIESLQKADLELERVTREVTQGQMGASALLPALRVGTDCTDAIKIIKSAKALVNSWNEILEKFKDGSKVSQAIYCKSIGGIGASNGWYKSDAMANGFNYPLASSVSYQGFPQPPFDYDTFNNGLGGGGCARFFPRYDTSVGTPYLTSVSCYQFASVGQHYGLLVDQLQGCTSLNPTITTTQSINTSQHLRWQDGKDVFFTGLVTGSAITGGAAATGTFTYTDQDGNAGATSTPIILGGSVSPNELLANYTNFNDRAPYIQLASGDYGARSVEDFIVGGTPASAGVVAFMMYKPILFYTVFLVQGLSGPYWFEKELPLGSLVRPLTDTSSLPYLTVLIKDAVGGSGTIGLTMEILWS